METDNTWYPAGLHELLRDLHRQGAAHDAITAEHAQRMLNITPDTGAFLAMQVRFGDARRVLEVGTSNGYSTVWLAWAATGVDGHITSIDFQAGKTQLADDNLDRAGLRDRCTLLTRDAREVLAEVGDDQWDLIFLDADRSQYASYWPDLRRALRSGGLLIVDNALSHPQEVAALCAAAALEPRWATVTLPVGKGEWMALKPGPDAPAR